MSSAWVRSKETNGWISPTTNRFDQYPSRMNEIDDDPKLMIQNFNV